MKPNYIIFIFITLTVAFCACKKTNNNLEPVIGTWQQTKLRVYTKNPAGIIVNDTTYSGATFTALDHIQFNYNGTCSISGSHQYAPAGLGNGSIPVYNVSTLAFNYSRSGSAYILTTPIHLINPGGFNSTDTATLQGPANLLLHNTNYPNIPTGNRTFYDSYYIR